jgi:hypothetical protein
MTARTTTRPDGPSIATRAEPLAATRLPPSTSGKPNGAMETMTAPSRTPLAPSMFSTRASTKPTDAPRASPSSIEEETDPSRCRTSPSTKRHDDAPFPTAATDHCVSGRLKSDVGVWFSSFASGISGVAFRVDAPRCGIRDRLSFHCARDAVNITLVCRYDDVRETISRRSGPETRRLDPETTCVLGQSRRVGLHDGRLASFSRSRSHHPESLDRHFHRGGRIGARPRIEFRGRGLSVRRIDRQHARPKPRFLAPHRFSSGARRNPGVPRRRDATSGRNACAILCAPTALH